MVIVFPLAMLIVLLCVQAGLWFLSRAAANDAAFDGARAAAVVGATSASAKNEASSVLSKVAGPLVSSDSINVTRNATTATVSVSARSESILPGLSLPIHASASSPLESFRP